MTEVGVNKPANNVINSSNIEILTVSCSIM